MSDVCELAGKLHSHFIGWTSKGHSSTFDSEDLVHEAGTAANVNTEHDESAEHSDGSADSSSTQYEVEHIFVRMRKSGLRILIMFHLI